MRFPHFIKAIFIMTFIAQSSFAQKGAIRVCYVKQTKVPASIEQMEDVSIRQLAIQKLQQQIQSYTLYYNGNEYAFSQATLSEDGASFTLEGNNSVYFNRQDKQKISLERVIDKLFVVTDTIARYDWEIKYDESKEILGKHCTKAVLAGNKDVVAWFCDEIPVQVGPRGYSGLPGLILRLETSSSICEATDVATVSDSIKITVPDKGKISSEKFREIKEKKLKELGAQKEGGNLIILQQ